MLRHTSANSEVGLRILEGTILLLTLPTRLTSTSQFFVLGLGVVDGRMLAKDEMRASEFSDQTLSLSFSIVRSFLTIPVANLRT